MCGDLEEEGSLDEALMAWLLADAKAHGVSRPRTLVGGTTAEPGSSAWMTDQFRSALSQALSVIDQAPEGTRPDALGSQAIVLARLAGFLAGHLPPETEIFRNLVDALVDGHREPERRSLQAQSHGHGHDYHGHGHEH